jgi:transcription elongation factor B subunit 2
MFTACQPPEKQQLLKGSLVLEDAKKLADLKVENDDVVALTLMNEGTLD